MHVRYDCDLGPRITHERRDRAHARAYVGVGVGVGVCGCLWVCLGVYFHGCGCVLWVWGVFLGLGEDVNGRVREYEGGRERGGRDGDTHFNIETKLSFARRRIAPD